MSPTASSPLSHWMIVARTASRPSRVFPLRAHSQTFSCRHPNWWSDSCTASSRVILLAIFVRQNSGLVEGSLNRWQSWPCQKHPFTKMTVLYFRSTISGLPGKPAAWSRYRNPRANSPLRIRSSGLVFRLLMPDIIRLRVCWSTISGNRLYLFLQLNL